MTNYAFFANSASMELLSGATAVGCAVLKNVKMTPKFAHSPLFGMESATRQAIAKYQHEVEVNFKYAMWDPQNDYVFGSFLAGQTGYKSQPATLWDDAAHRNQVATFNITATVYDHTRSVMMVATVFGVYFESIPFEFTENEWMTRDLTGTGAYMEWSTQAIT